MKIFSAFGKPTVKAVATVAADTPAAKIAKQLEKDVFVKQDLSKLSLTELAKRFRNSFIVPYADWTTALPKDAEAGSKVLAETIKKFIKPIEKLNPDDTEHFVRLIMGDSQLPVINEAVSSNTSIRELVTLLEKKTGKTLEKIILK